MTTNIFQTINHFADTSHINAGISLRNGGVSKPPFASLNLASHVGDNPSDVIQNRQIFLKESGVDIFKYVHQIHSNKVLNAELLTSCSWNDKHISTPKITGDSIISDRQGDTICIFTADCVPIFISDKGTPAIGIVHAGWRGTLSQIVSKTLMQMKKCLGTQFEDCLIHLGPSIHQCCYTVNEKMIAQFANKFGKNVHDGMNLSLQTANYVQLIEQGIKPENITNSQFCTSCRLDMFYSYRAEGGNTGRMLSFIQLI